MSAMTDAWRELRAANAAEVAANTATVGAFATNKPCIVSAVDLDELIAAGGVYDEGGYELQMAESDFSGEPPKGTAVTCTALSGTFYVIKDPRKTDGTWYLQVGNMVSIEG